MGWVQMGWEREWIWGRDGLGTGEGDELIQLGGLGADPLAG